MIECYCGGYLWKYWIYVKLLHIKFHAVSYLNVLILIGFLI
jgi:hypothetical protein